MHPSYSLIRALVVRLSRHDKLNKVSLVFYELLTCFLFRRKNAEVRTKCYNNFELKKKALYSLGIFPSRLMTLRKIGGHKKEASLSQ